jgi:uncharacterized Zn finger protein
MKGRDTGDTPEAHVARKHPKTPEQGWKALTWQDVEEWAGSRSLERGQSYQRSGRVRDLAINQDGELLAWVQGTHRYVTSVGLTEDGKPLGSCTCPLGSGSCKHAVAVVLDYLAALKHKRAVPLASDDDRRWAALDHGPLDEDEWDEEDDYDEDDQEEDEEEEEKPRPRRRARTEPAAAGPLAYLNGLSASELVALLTEYAGDHPEIRRDLERRGSLASGKVNDLVRQARKETNSVTRQRGWRNSWDGEGETPDYTHLKDTLERLLALGAADAVLDLGRDLAEQGFSQVSESHDEGETAGELLDCLNVVFRAVPHSSRPDEQKLLYAIDLCLDDDYDVCQGAHEVLEREWPQPAWSAVADELARRLEASSAVRDDFHLKYKRSHLVNWLWDSLEKAGRQDEVIPLLEREAPLTDGYERLIGVLLDEGRLDDARRWIVEGIKNTSEKYPGIARNLREQWRKLATETEDWPTVAAMRAEEFFLQPSSRSLSELSAAAEKVGCRAAVEGAAMRFLETGERPKVATKPKGKSKKTEPADVWPLPALPEFLTERVGARWQQPGPHYDVLLSMALEAKNPEDVLRWFDRLRAERKGQWSYSYHSEATVADAVADTHPDRAIELYREIAEGYVAQTKPSAYEAALPYFRKLRAVLVKTGKAAEWTRYEADLREKHRRKTTFIAVLDRVVTKRIIDT